MKMVKFAIITFIGYCLFMAGSYAFTLHELMVKNINTIDMILK